MGWADKLDEIDQDVFEKAMQDSTLMSVLLFDALFENFFEFMLKFFFRKETR